MAFREVTTAGLRFTERHEGRIGYVYDDAVYPTKPYKAGTKVRGTLTGGVGHTGADLQQWIGKTIPANVIDAWLDKDLDVAEIAVSRLVKVPLADSQHNVVCDFTYNAGVGALTSSTLLKKLNQGKYDTVPAELAKWVYTTIDGKKQRSNGLVKRRAAEAAYWSGVAVADTKLTEINRPDHEPTGTQVAEAAPPPTLNAETISTATGVVSMFAGFTTGPIAWVFAGIAAVAFAVGLYYFVTKRLFPR